MDVETALEAIRIARAEIGIDPWDDPIEDIVEWSFEREVKEIRKTGQTQKLKKLINDAEEAQKDARKKTKELQRKERELRDISTQLEKEKKAKIQPVAVESAPPVAAASTAEEKETILNLRRRIDKLKGEVSAQQQIRRGLREELRAEKEKSLKSSGAEAVQTEDYDDSAPLNPGILKNILIPGYSAAFRQACETVPAPVAAKAVKAVGDFAAGGEDTWRRTRPIKKIRECYRIKIDRDFRLLIHWKAGEKIEALDLIPRKKLETWIRHNS